MNKSLADINEQQKEKYKTTNNTFDDFPVGTRVKVACALQDFYFFYEETGTVIENTHDYLGILVEFDKPRHFKGGAIQKDFNFAPDDLCVLKTKNKCSMCKKCGEELYRIECLYSDREGIRNDYYCPTCHIRYGSRSHGLEVLATPFVKGDCEYKHECIFFAEQL